MKFIAIVLSMSLILSDAAVCQPARIGVAGAVNGRVLVAPQPKAVGKVIETGKDLFHDNEVTTDAQGRLQILLLDETVFTIGPGSSLVLDEFVYDPSTSDGKIAAKVTKGVFRFITGKIARKDPEKMKVNVPVGTIGIRGTIAAGKVDDKSAIVMLLGPGSENNAQEHAGAITLTGGGKTVEILRPGYGSRIDGPGRQPSDPFLVPPDLVNQILGALAPKPTKGTKDEGRRKASATKQSGQDIASAIKDAEATEDMADYLQDLSDTAQNGIHDRQETFIFPDGDATWDQVRRLGNGTGTYQGTGVFTQTNSSFGPTNTVGTTTLNLLINFGTRTIGGPGSTLSALTAGISPINDSTNISAVSYAGLGGIARITLGNANSSNASFNNSTITLINSGGAPAQAANARVIYSNVNLNQGNGFVSAPR